jgi:hypothetical protein
VHLLLFAAVAHSVSGDTYTGRTSQGEKVSFSISGGYLRRLDFMIDVKCASKRAYRVRDYAFPAIPIIHARFAEMFVSSNPKATAAIRGTVLSQVVAGTLKDTTYIKKEQRSCHGSATFNLHHD